MASATVRNEGFDHMTVVVTDLDAARRFFGLLGFVERVAVVAQGDEIARYMGIEDWEADHVTLVLEDAPVHQEVQLLRFHRPAARSDDGAGTLTRVGFNHVCFRVANLGATLAHLAAHGVQPRNEIMDFHDRRLVFLDGPGIVVELAEWVSGSAGQGAHLGSP
jgi:catechol 2,3-dioxygenase-like lactoylglutathione lyase family enzyme